MRASPSTVPSLFGIDGAGLAMVARARAAGMMRPMEVPEGDVDELVEFWTLLGEDRALLSSDHSVTAHTLATQPK